MTTKITTQAELDEALKAGQTDLEFTAKGDFAIRGFKNLSIKMTASLRFDIRLLLENATATLWGNATATLLENATATLLENATATLLENATATLWGNATATLLENATATLRENATATLWGNATATLWGNATAKASGYCSLSLWDKAKATLSKTCHAFIMSKDAKATGGTQTKSELKTANDWCEYYGVETEKGHARVYKALHDGFASHHDRSFTYLPGTKPKAEKFDKEECSHGLHFSPHPTFTLQFVDNPKHFVECWVKISEMLVFFNGGYPSKCKAPEVVRPVIEVDIHARPIEQKQVAA